MCSRFIHICIGKLLTDLTQEKNVENKKNSQTKMECRDAKKNYSITFIIHGVYWFWLSLIFKMRAMAMSVRLRRKCIGAKKKILLLLLRHPWDTKRPRSGQLKKLNKLNLTEAHICIVGSYWILCNSVCWFFFGIWYFDRLQSSVWISRMYVQCDTQSDSLLIFYGEISQFITAINLWK